ncbi:MAG: hypothetical protein E7342_02370 [Clostridiales bacterium]|nr:hypothetical protein [Clostridiales bacterium]
MFKRFACLLIVCLTVIAFTFINFDYVFSDYEKQTVFYKGQGGSLSKEVVGGFNFLGVLGQSIVLSEEETKKVIENLNAKIVFIEEIGETTNYYCYTNKLKYGVTLKKQRVNLHLSTTNGKITLGTPLIFGSF